MVTILHELTILCSYSPPVGTGERMSGLGATTFALSRSRSGGRKSGSLVLFVGEGSEGTGDRDALDEVGESGGSIIDSSMIQQPGEFLTSKTTKFPRKMFT